MISRATFNKFPLWHYILENKEAMIFFQNGRGYFVTLFRQKADNEEKFPLGVCC